MKTLITILATFLLIACSKSDDEETKFSALPAGFITKSLPGYVYTYSVYNSADDTLFFVGHEVVNDVPRIIYLDTLLSGQMSDRVGLNNASYATIVYRWASKEYLTDSYFETEFPAMDDNYISKKCEIEVIDEIYVVMLHR